MGVPVARSKEYNTGYYIVTSLKEERRHRWRGLAGFIHRCDWSGDSSCATSANEVLVDMRFETQKVFALGISKSLPPLIKPMLVTMEYSHRLCYDYTRNTLSECVKPMNKELQFLIYNTPEADIAVNAVVKDDTVWLTQKAMAELFGCSSDNISLHLKNIYSEGELDERATTEDFSVVQNEGARQVKRTVRFYSLDAIISVGYRVNSRRATQFRIWATGILKEYMTKGFAMDDERLKQGKTAFGVDYFRELLERVRSIRASERRIWQQITDIFAECSIDYDKDSETTHDFYAMVQNKFHYAITGQTAAEIVYAKADRYKPNMGLETYKNAPDGRILKSDVTVAKNYLPEKQIRQLERTVTGYFDYIEDLIERENVFTMQEFARSVNEFLAFRKYDILRDKGKVSGQDAKAKAEAEYAEFNKTQKLTSDFDRMVRQLPRKETNKS